MNNFNSKYDDNKKDGRLYFSSMINKTNGSNYRKAEVCCDLGKTYTEKQYGRNQENVEFEIKDKINLFESDMGQAKYWCWLVSTENGNSTSGLHICRRTSKGNLYSEQEITLNAHAIVVLKKI